jgi:L-lactate dehydrogenase complex protein LldG
MEAAGGALETMEPANASRTIPATGGSATAREVLFASIRRALGVSGREAPRRKAIADRLREHPEGVIPARGKLPPDQRVALFRTMAEAAASSVEAVPQRSGVPAVIAAFLRSHNLPMRLRCGDDERLASMPWHQEPTLEISKGPSAGTDAVALSHAFGGAAESGTLMLISGKDNPTTLNFLPDTHVVIVDAAEIAGDYETLWQRLRETFRPGMLPRTVNLITGPSRSADIEQTLILGAHGPRQLHIIIVGAPE